MKPSTKAFREEGKRTADYSFFDWLHGYIYIRWPYLYISLGTGEHPLARFLMPLLGQIERIIIGSKSSRTSSPETANKTLFEETYHGKVVPLDAAKELVSIKEEICLENLETVIPYAHARDIIMLNPDHIVLLECPCRVARENPCLPLDVCIIVGEPFAGFIAEHHPQRSRWITAEEAAGVLEAEHRRGHVHHAFFKDAMLNRFYAICNCCSCCCGAMQAQRNGVFMLTASGYTAQKDETLCINCGDCAALCQFNALTIVDNRTILDAETCMGCGVCVTQCAQGALTLVRDPQKGAPLEIRELMDAVH